MFSSTKGVVGFVAGLRTKHQNISALCNGGGIYLICTHDPGTVSVTLQRRIDYCSDESSPPDRDQVVMTCIEHV